MKRRDTYKPFHWSKYGLSIDHCIVGSDFRDACIAHNLVYDYLEEHPEITFPVDKDGKKTYYFDILTKAKKEVERDSKNV